MLFAGVEEARGTCALGFELVLRAPTRQMLSVFSFILPKHVLRVLAPIETQAVETLPPELHARTGPQIRTGQMLLQASFFGLWHIARRFVGLELVSGNTEILVGLTLFFKFRGRDALVPGTAQPTRERVCFETNGHQRQSSMSSWCPPGHTAKFRRQGLG